MNANIVENKDQQICNKILQINKIKDLNKEKNNNNIHKKISL